MIALGASCSSNDQLNEAEANFKEAIDISSHFTGRRRVIYAQAVEGLGDALLGKEKRAEAEIYYQQAIATRTELFGPDAPNVVNLLGSMAEIYRSRGELEKSGEYFKRAWAIYEEKLGVEHPAAANLLNSYAGMWEAQSDYVKAEKLYQQALAIDKGLFGAEHPEYVSTIDNLAGLYLRMGDAEKSEELRRQIVDLRERLYGPSHTTVAQSISNLGIAIGSNGRLAEAEACFRRSLEIYQGSELKEHPAVAIVLGNLGDVLEKQGNLDGAMRAYSQALPILSNTYGAEHPNVSRLTTKIAAVYYQKGRYYKAETLQRRALRNLESVFNKEHPDVINATENLASLNLARGGRIESIKRYASLMEASERALRRNVVIGSERQKVAYISTFTKLLNEFISLHTIYSRTNPRAMNLALTSILRLKGRGLDEVASNIASLRDEGSDEGKALLQQWAELRSQLSNLTLRGYPGKDLNGYILNRMKIEAALEKTENDISERNAEYRSRYTPVTLEKIQPLVDDHSALLEYAVYAPYDVVNRQYGKPRYVVYIINAQGAPRWADLGEASRIDSAVDEFRRALRDPTRSDVKQAAQKLQRLVLFPARRWISREVNHLLISPDGDLNLTPFAALVDDHSEYLVNRYTITYLTSGRDLLRLQNKQDDVGGDWIVADPAFDASDQAGDKRDIVKSQKPGVTEAEPGPEIKIMDLKLSRLPGSGEEAAALKHLLKDAHLFTGEEATETLLKQVKRARILHIATHGIFLRNSEEIGRNRGGLSIRKSFDARFSKTGEQNPQFLSGLVFAGANQGKSGQDDGILTALEAAGLDLRGTKLVALSACNTGVGDVKNGEGVYGLRRAFVLAGSESQLMSLWSVSDQATKELMVRYYKQLIGGEARGRALRSVQLQMLQEKKLQHPYYWAGFIQSGEWRELDARK